MPPTLALLFDRGGRGLVAQARTAASRILAQKLLSCRSVERVVVATRSTPDWEDLPVEVIPDPPGQWRLGAQLEGVVKAFRPQRLLYFSSGSGFLLPEEKLSFLTHCWPSSPPFAVLNNFYSTDFGVLVPPPEGGFSDLVRDNPLGLRLWRAGYRCYELPRSAVTQLDIDTPGELQLLALVQDLPQELARVLRDVPTDRAQAILDLMTRVGGELLVVGRVAGQVLRVLEKTSACRVRVLSEERGMASLGLADAAKVRSLLSFVSSNPAQLVSALASLADGVVWDTRVWLAAQGLWPLPEDRFACDLLLPEEVKTPLLKELAEACLAAPVPFLLGGHALVSGGLYLAAELAWQGKPELPERWSPLPLPD